jgi:hypothetical protein
MRIIRFGRGASGLKPTDERGVETEELELEEAEEENDADKEEEQRGIRDREGTG